MRGAAGGALRLRAGERKGVGWRWEATLTAGPRLAAREKSGEEEVGRRRETRPQ
jgi:hypothetical protein